jgi:2-succinyl-6-hydroxy-2,4-cyclohexadiene-1-carboxylate synthase
VAVDAPGHGRSADVHIDLWSAGVRIIEACGPSDLVGYSMGGRMCLHSAIAAPDWVERLVLVGATAGILDDDARAARRTADEALAARIEAGGDTGLPEFLREWLTGPLFARLDDQAADLPSRLENTAAGLASSLRLCGTGSQEPLDDRLREITAPTLLVVGELDRRFRTEAERIAAGIPNAQIVEIAGAGHACHLEQPAAFLDVLREWLG